MLDLQLCRLLLAWLLIVSGSQTLIVAFKYEGGAKRSLDTRDTSSSNKTVLPAQFYPEFNSSRVMIRYGPWNVPSMDMMNGMGDYYTRDAEMPCTDCLITWMQAGFEYPNGTYANANTSLWLHHTFLVNSGRSDAVCGMGWGGERFFASGNERTVVDICMNGTDQVGYYIGPTDRVRFEAELMNADMVNQTATVTITYEYIPKPPSSFTKVTPVWLDIGGCDNPELPAKANTTFNYVSPAWTSTLSGKITTILGHVHDGGINIDILRNNQTVCNDVASYGQSPGYISPASMDMGMGMDMNMSMSSMPPATNDSTTSPSMLHISSISTCSGQAISAGDLWTVNAHYDTTKYAPMLDTDGSLMPIMGISLFYVAEGQVGSNATLTVGANGMDVAAAAAASGSGSATATSATATVTGTTTSGAGGKGGISETVLGSVVVGILLVFGGR